MLHSYVTATCDLIGSAEIPANDTEKCPEFQTLFLCDGDVHNVLHPVLWKMGLVQETRFVQCSSQVHLYLLLLQTKPAVEFLCGSQRTL